MLSSARIRCTSSIRIPIRYGSSIRRRLSRARPSPADPRSWKIDLRTDSVARIYPLGRDAVPQNGYLNDIRLGKGVAYLTESGTGAILVLDLKTGNVRRLLSNSAVTKADPRRIPLAAGHEMRKLSGEVFRVHADAIEVSPDGRWLYFAPVDGLLRRVKTADLRNPKLSEEELARRVEIYADIPPSARPWTGRETFTFPT